MYNVEFTKQAIKDLQKIPKNYAVSIFEKIRKLSANPYSTALNIKKLKGVDGYRLRVGEYRIIYDMEATKLLISIIKVKSRGNIYG